jgi:hypothetical protein
MSEPVHIATLMCQRFIQDAMDNHIIGVTWQPAKARCIVSYVTNVRGSVPFHIVRHICKNGQCIIPIVAEHILEVPDPRAHIYLVWYLPDGFVLEHGMEYHLIVNGQHLTRHII